MIKIIDKRGMVFGRINIIDLMVVIFILCLTPMFYAGYKLFDKASKSKMYPLQATINWEQKYNEEIQKIKTFCNEYKRASICK